MKRFALTLIVSLTTYLSSFAIGFFSFTEAQEHAYYLTDKMAYELDLTPAQYDQVYQVNLEYFINVDRAGLKGPLWQYRNADLSYILYDWQYALYRNARYFYYPLEFRHSTWFMPLWDRYTRNYYFYTRPTCWHTWRGGLWIGRVHNTPSPFIGHRPHVHKGGMRGDRPAAPGRPGYNPNPGHGNNNGYRPDNNRPGNNNGYRPDNNRPGNNNGYRPGNNNGYRPDNNRPGNNGGSFNGGSNNNRPGNNGGSFNGGSNNNRPGGNGGSFNGGSNSNNSRPSRGGASAPSRDSRGGSSTGTGNGTRSFGGR